MPIYVEENEQLFHLQGENISYLFKVLPNKQLGSLYFGKRLRHTRALVDLYYGDVKDNSCFYKGTNETLSLDYTKQEYPSFGTSDFREPAIHVKQKNGSRITEFAYAGYTILKGKPKLTGLPSTYVEESDEATTLIVKLIDETAALTLELSYTLYEFREVITRNARLFNHGKHAVSVNQIMSMSLDFSDADFELIELFGSWARERHVSRHLLHPGVQKIESKRGTSSPQHNPFITLVRPDTTEDRGEAYGFSLVYSGNFLAQVEVDHYQTSRVLMGINPFDFSYQVEPEQSFQTPEVVMAYSDQGLNHLSQTYHHLYRTRLARGKWRDKCRPVLMNNWEATYFDFNEEKLVEMAKAAKQCGIELFVLDDGWFGKRDDDTTSLGDWFVDKRKLPNGLTGLVDKIKAEGLLFGLWIEPEMVSEDSDLFRRHPEWVLKVPDRKPSPGRHQFVLDLTQPEVVDYLTTIISARLSEATIDYVKWDMNRYLTEVGSVHLKASHQQETAHRYMLGVYELYERLTSRFPDVLFESCASGGARFDPGMLYYAPQAWTSDNTDAIERMNIQYGTTFVYPPSMMGAHVSAVPNHQTGRITPFETRTAVSFLFMLGYELDPTALTAGEKDQMKRDIIRYKALQSVIQTGLFYRLLSPFDDMTRASYMVVSKDQKEAVVTYVQTFSQANPGYRLLKLKGLATDLNYQVNGGPVLSGDLLIHHGLELDRVTERKDRGDYRGFIIHLSAVEEELSW